MNYKIINLVTDDFDKSIVFYGEYGKDTFVKDTYFYLMKELNITFKDKVFRIDRASIDFNSKHSDWFEDEVDVAMKKRFNEGK